MATYRGGPPEILCRLPAKLRIAAVLEIAGRDFVLLTLSARSGEINLSPELQRSRLARLARTFQMYDATPRQLSSTATLPGKDEPILLAAIEAQVMHLITGDTLHSGNFTMKSERQGAHRSQISRAESQDSSPQ